MEVTLRALPKDHKGELQAGDIYYAEYLKDWYICLPIPIEDQNQYRKFVEFALNTVASNGCPHNNRERHRCWTITGDKELEGGDASKLTLMPSILLTYDPEKTIHGFVTNGKWKSC
ncbi:MAG: hypothetical protein ACRDFB_01615 [Rhabdochlamydiaceae bacterium]